MKSIIATIALLCITVSGFGQTTDFTKLDSYFKVLEEHDLFFGSVAVSQHGKVVYSKTIGYADVATKTPNTNTTKLRIGSVTKTFTAVLVMKAVELGKLELDQTIEGYFPRIQNADKITVRHLLNHRSGITNFTDRSFFSWYTKPLPQTALLDTIISKGIDFEPDAKHQYSNSNYTLLTFILEDIFEQTYAESLEQFIVKPLGLKQTAYGGKIDLTKNEARSYRMNDTWKEQPESDMSIPLGAGGIVSTATDLSLFSDAIFSGRLVSAESLKQMYPEEGQSYGFALEYQMFDELQGLGHGGDIDAFTSNLAYFKEHDLSIALISNGISYSKHDIQLAMLSEITGKPYKVPSFEHVELSAEVLDQYLGTYKTTELPMEFNITKDGNALFMGITGQPASELQADGDHQFSIMKYGVKITFIPEEKKMHYSQNGMQFEMTLVETSETVEVQDENLEQYSGTYTSDDLPMDLIISKDGDVLMGQGTGQSAFPLVSEGDHVFTNKEIGLTITFIPSDKKLHFEQGGAEFEMKLG